MRLAKINDQRIAENVIVANELWEGYVPCPEWVSVGDSIDMPEPPKPPAPAPEPLSPEHIEVLRRKAYQDESDPLFFKWQRGEATQQEWLDKVAEIKARDFNAGNGQLPVTEL
jgi:hypothetical protein